MVRCVAMACSIAVFPRNKRRGPSTPARRGFVGMLGGSR